jgi:hypothetical protein
MVLTMIRVPDPKIGSVAPRYAPGPVESSKIPAIVAGLMQVNEQMPNFKFNGLDTTG